MNPSPGDGWRAHGAPPGNAGLPQGSQPAVRSLGGFGLNPTQQQTQQQIPGPVLPPPSYHSTGQSSGHSLPTIADLTQGAPSSHSQPTSYNQHNQSASSTHSLPGLGQTMQQQSPQTAINREREREIREQEMRERELIDRQERQRQDELLMREREQRDRDIIERQQREQHHPVQSHTGSIPLHQPVASKVTNNIHGPNGLLSGLGPSHQNAPAPLPPGSGPNTLLHASIQRPEDTPRSFIPQPVQAPTHTVSGSSPVGMAQGQQPILNDALSYLDQVKGRFADQPDVYNRFLDIMKDFKSQAIDTPGVIGRVSNLFNGHPVLIQGFNTFLPPGYRIECGTDDNPETIRVTTPSGTITQQLQRRGGPGAHYSFDGPDGQALGTQFSRVDSFDTARNSYHQQHVPQGSGSAFSPTSRPANQTGYNQLPASETPVSFEVRQQEQDRAANAALVHQQEERGVSQLQSAVSAATNGASVRQPMMPLSPGPPANLMHPAGVIPGAGVPGAQGDLGRRGPVEFNHAISYVNKIKNRFNQQPEIYKQFLEILQTYQRESRPIQDVYAQVTQLFSTAPDLLDDFKQFLPESAAQAKAAAAAKAAAEDAVVNNSRSDPAYIASQLPQTQTPRPTTKMPPMGQFDPPSSTKDNKKRRGAPGQNANQQGSQTADSGPITSAQGGRIQGLQGGTANKRAKTHHHKTTQPEPSASVTIDPTIIPSLPVALPPSSSYATQQDEFSFFDRVRKAIGNKATYTEFLKLVNLFTQDMIDKQTLLDRARPYLDAHPDLITYFTGFLRVALDDGNIEARALPDPGRVNLSHCRSLGPSYRYLPKREQNKVCKGRDEMCYEVLNDEWASYPTWASEDSGFIAHRKNIWEDGLHRLEEERHDYDTYIEACQRTIQLMEPLVQQIHSMTTDSERSAFILHPGLGGQSETIYQRVIKKIYDRERGGKVIEEMFARPAQVLPVVLSRLKQKLEEWKQGQREWEKVWREQQIKFYWKSLDHQGINVKVADKKMFQLKTMVTEIQAKRAEATKSREAGYQVRKHQYEHRFSDQEVLLDCCKLVLDSTGQDKSLSGGEQAKVNEFMKDFGTTFFGIDLNDFDSHMQEHSAEDTTTEADDHDAPADGSSSSDHQAANKPKAHSVNVNGMLEEPAHPSIETKDEDQEGGKGAHGSNAETPDRWITIANHHRRDRFRRETDPNEPYYRKTYNMYCNANIYYFYRLFETLYSRLLWIKEHEADVERDVRISMSDKPATKLGINDRLPKEYFTDVSAGANYYRQIVGMCELAILGGQDSQTNLEDTLRRFYLPNGYKLYGIANLLQTVTRSISSNIFGNDTKDRSPDIFNLFTKDRAKEQTTHREEVQYRQQVSKLVKEGDVYKITWNTDSKKTTVQIMANEEGTFDDDELDDEARYSYYVSAYAMIQDTEGVDQEELQKSSLPRNLRVASSIEDDGERFEEYFGNMASHTTLELKISPDDYAIKQWVGGDTMIRKTQFTSVDALRKDRWEQVARNRREKFNKTFTVLPAWATDESEQSVAEVKKAYQSWIQDGPRDIGSGDVSMADA